MSALRTLFLSPVIAVAIRAVDSSSVYGTLPIVDLGYVRQQASAFNETGQYYNFTNVAYAEPPVGSLRFAAPQPPKHSYGIRDGGSVPIWCYQAYPDWLAQQLSLSTPVPTMPGESEDCLYLDVLTPKEVFDHRHHSSGAAVLVWIHGGGYDVGSKTNNGPGTGLVARSMTSTTSSGIVYVAINYRLGAFGFLGGETLTRSGGTPNAGLHDQRLALNWVKQHIRKFGGDPSRVTVMGESGGGSSIGHQIVARLPGHSKAPFNQAILQSPAEVPFPSASQLKDQLDTFLETLGVGSVHQARKLSGADIQSANKAIIRNGAIPHFTYGPSPDGVFVNGRASQDLLKAQLDPDMNIMVAHNLAEGVGFAPNPDNITAFRTFVKFVIPAASPDEINHIVNVLYPAPGPATAYSTDYERAVLFIGELYVDCNVNAIGRAFAGKPYAYEFSVPPAYHVFDLNYTFFNGASEGVANDTVAIAMQTYFTNFAVHGDPNANLTLPQMPTYGALGDMLNLTNTGFGIAKDPAVNQRCEYWTKPTKWSDGGL